MSAPFRSGTQRVPLTTTQPTPKGGLLSVVAAFLNNRGYGSPGSNFGPGAPVMPTFQQDESEGGNPRLFEYPVGSNLLTKPRSEDKDLTPFDRLRSLAANYDVANLCHQTLCNEIAAMDWDITTTPWAEGDRTSHKSDIKSVRTFLTRPDGDLYLDEWASMLLREDLQIGAPAFYKHGTLGGQIGALEIVQGDLLKPLIDFRGKVIAYEEVYRNVVLHEPWPASKIVYCPRIRTRKSVYGLAPMELVLLNANIALRRETFELAYFTDGNIPDSLAGLPDTYTPQQVKEFQEWWDNMASGQDGERRKLKFWPGDPSKIFEFTKKEENTEHAMWTLRVTCAIHGIKPEEIGFTMHSNRSTAQQSAKSQERAGVRPVAAWLSRVLTDVIQNDLGHPDLRFLYNIRKEEQDELQTAQAHSTYISAGVYDAQYVRDQLGVQDKYVPEVPATFSPPGPLNPNASPGAPSFNGPASHTNQPDVPAPGTDRDGDAGKLMRADMRKWYDKASRAARMGKSAGVSFDSEHIPDALHKSISDALSSATTGTEIRAAFASEYVEVPA